MLTRIDGRRSGYSFSFFGYIVYHSSLGLYFYTVGDIQMAGNARLAANHYIFPKFG